MIIEAIMKVVVVLTILSPQNIENSRWCASSEANKGFLVFRVRVVGLPYSFTNIRA